MLSQTTNQVNRFKIFEFGLGYRKFVPIRPWTYPELFGYRTRVLIKSQFGRKLQTQVAL